MLVCQTFLQRHNWMTWTWSLSCLCPIHIDLHCMPRIYTYWPVLFLGGGISTVFKIDSLLCVSDISWQRICITVRVAGRASTLLGSPFCGLCLVLVQYSFYPHIGIVVWAMTVLLYKRCFNIITYVAAFRTAGCLGRVEVRTTRRFWRTGALCFGL